MSDLRCRGCDHELKPRTCVLYGCECECDNILQDDPTPEMRERIISAVMDASSKDIEWEYSEDAEQFAQRIADAVLSTLGEPK